MSKTYANHKGVKAAQPPEKGQAMYKDTQAKGLYLRVYSNGKKAFIHRYSINGTERLITLDVPELTTSSTERQISEALTKARALHAQQRAEIRAGNDPAIERDLKAAEIAAMPTLEEFAPVYIKRHAKPKKKSWSEDERILNTDILPVLGKMRLDQIKRKHLIALLDKKQDSPYARNKVIMVLSKLFNVAVDRGVIEYSPALRLGRTKDNERERILSETEIRLLWEATGDQSGQELSTRFLFRLALVTGARVGEVARLTESQIMGDWWRLPTTKNGRPFEIFLTPLAKQIIDEMRPHARNGLIFANRKGEVKHSANMSNTFKDLKVEWESNPLGTPRPHDLRRTFTTGLASLGFSRFIQNLCTNHADSGISGIYDRHTYANERIAAWQAWDRRLTEVITGGPVSNVVPFHKAV